jgi:hypothetical protein
MNPSNGSFQELEAILAKEYEAHEQLLTAVASVNSAIKGSDLAALQGHTGRLDEQIFQIGRLEEQRQECCSALARTLGLAAQGTVKLAALVEKAPEALREKLAALHGLLKKAVATISRINISNRILLEEGLQLVRGRITVMTQPSEQFAQYRSRGNRAAAALPHRSLINRTI